MADKTDGEKESFLKKVWDAITLELITKFILSLFVLSVPTAAIITKAEITDVHKAILEELLISLLPCAGENETEKVVLEVFGYASSAVFEGLPIMNLMNGK